LSVGFKDLVKTGLFRSPSAVGSFLRHYKGYEFLAPIPVNAFGIPPTERAQWLSIGALPGDDTGMMMIRLGELLERKILYQGDRRRLTQKQEVEQAMQVVAARREDAENHSRGRKTATVSPTARQQAMQEHIDELKESDPALLVSLAQSMLHAACGNAHLAASLRTQAKNLQEQPIWGAPNPRQSLSPSGALELPSPWRDGVAATPVRLVSSPPSGHADTTVVLSTAQLRYASEKRSPFPSQWVSLLPCEYSHGTSKRESLLTRAPLRTTPQVQQREPHQLGRHSYRVTSSPATTVSVTQNHGGRA